MAMCLAACSWKGEGLVREGALGPTLETSTGERYKLVYGERDRMLAHLGEHLVLMEGRRVGRNLKVSSWQIPAGKHGMPVWYGLLERKGAQVGLLDRGSRAWYFLDRESARQAVQYVGKDILVEGYVDGPHVIQVLHLELLDQ